MSKRWRTNSGRYIGSGFCRDVYDLRNGHVIKFAKSAFGVKSNRTEFHLYRSLPRRLRRYLGRVKGHGRGFRWIIMRNYWREFPDSHRYRARLKRVRKLFRRCGIHPYETVARQTGEPNYQNLRLHRTGRVIVIDYGNFRRRR